MGTIGALVNAAKLASISSSQGGLFSPIWGKLVRSSDDDSAPSTLPARRQAQRGPPSPRQSPSGYRREGCRSNPAWCTQVKSRLHDRNTIHRSHTVWIQSECASDDGEGPPAVEGHHADSFQGQMLPPMALMPPTGQR